MKNVGIKRGDNVIVIAGKDKGKKGKVLVVNPDSERIIVEGINMVKRHTKARRQGESSSIVHKEGTIHISNVMRICSKCGKPTRAAKAILDNGEKAKMCTKCREVYND